MLFPNASFVCLRHGFRIIDQCVNMYQQNIIGLSKIYIMKLSIKLCLIIIIIKQLLNTLNVIT